jgi:hypothetical protein
LGLQVFCDLGSVLVVMVMPWSCPGGVGSELRGEVVRPLGDRHAGPLCVQQAIGEDERGDEMGTGFGLQIMGSDPRE